MPVDVRRRSHPLLPARPTELVAMPALSSQSSGSPPTPHRRRTPAPPTASHRRYVVRTDRPTPLADAPYNGSDPTSTHSPHRGPLEAAPRVWHHSLELADHCDQLDPSDQALALLHTARHDADTMTHALGLGRSQARHPSNDETTRRGVRLLERAIAFLGVEAQPRSTARPDRRATLNPRRRT
jgi:hypothetical protein